MTLPTMICIRKEDDHLFRPVCVCVESNQPLFIPQSRDWGQKLGLRRLSSSSRLKQAIAWTPEIFRAHLQLRLSEAVGGAAGRVGVVPLAAYEKLMCHASMFFFCFSSLKRKRSPPAVWQAKCREYVDRPYVDHVPAVRGVV